MCREINSSFAHGNLFATVLLMRAVLNYVPPLFGRETFSQVAANIGRSLKDSFDDLENGLRKIADFHTHRRIGPTEVYSSPAQVEPFKPQFELLLQQVVPVYRPDNLKFRFGDARNETSGLGFVTRLLQRDAALILGEPLIEGLQRRVQRTSDLNIAIAAEAVSEVTLGLLAESSAPVKPRLRDIPEEFRKFLQIFLQHPD